MIKVLEMDVASIRVFGGRNKELTGKSRVITVLVNEGKNPR